VLTEKGVVLRMAELKPCPFCGTKQEEKTKGGFDIIAILRSTHDCYMVQCGKCYGSSGWKDTERKAISAWNKRVNA
jgi:Lar family restriction alleviation protein